jgi:hypothetical protein
VSAVLTELADLWGQYAQHVIKSKARRARSIFLNRDDGSGEALTIDQEGELRVGEFSAKNLDIQASATPEQCVAMVRYMCEDAQDFPERFAHPLPASIDRVRALLAEAGLEAPEVRIWEVYTASDTEKGA